MIVYGTRSIDRDLEGAPTVDPADHRQIELRDGQILQTIYELSFRGFEARLPPALHPSHPPLAVIFFYSVPDSDMGPFTMAQVRVSALAGISRFTYPVRGWIDNPEAGEFLARHWGYRFDPAGVHLRRRHDVISGRVEVDGRVVLESAMYDPDPVAGADANHAGHLNPAYVAGADGLQPMLVQAGPQLQFARCDRGRPRLVTYDESVIGGDRPYWNVSAFAGDCNFMFTPVQFLCDPMRPALEGGLSLAGGLQAV